jgi:hypothetical protein
VTGLAGDSLAEAPAAGFVPLCPGHLKRMVGRLNAFGLPVGSSRHLVRRDDACHAELFVRAKTEIKANSAQASTCRPIDSVSAQAGRKNTTASASTPRAAGRAVSLIVPPAEAFKMLIPMPSAKKP